MTRYVFALLCVLTLLVSFGTPAEAQRASLAFDSALAVSQDAPSPGVTFTAPMAVGDVLKVDLAAKPQQRVTGMQTSTVTSAAARVGTPARLFGRLTGYLDVGLAHLNGTLSIADAVGLEVTPGAKFYVRDEWGIGAAFPTTHLLTLPTAFAMDTRVVVSIFGEFGG